MLTTRFGQAIHGFCVTALLLGAAACGDDGNNSTPDLAGETLERALTFVGGRQAVEGLTGFQVTSSGTRYVEDEGLTPGGEAIEASTFTATASFDVTAETKLRIDYVRTVGFLGGLEFTYSEIVDGNLGYVSGKDGLFVLGIPDYTGAPMLSQRLSSGLKQQTLLNPHLLLAKAAADASLVSHAGTEDVGGTAHDILVVADAVADIEILVSSTDGHIASLRTMTNRFLRRDTAVEVTYEEWTDYSGVKFPAKVTIKMGEDTIHVEERSMVEVNPTFEADAFTIPEGAMPMFNADDALWGEQNMHFFQSFASVGIPIDMRQDTIMAVQATVDGTAQGAALEGVWHIMGGSHHTMVVEQENGIVVVEAPNFPERADKIIEWIGDEFPNKPITHVIATHHHQDHTAGLRSFVAAGATIVVHATAQEFFDGIFKAPSTVTPDKLAQNVVDANFMTVSGSAPLTLEDANNPVTVYPITSTHSADLVLIQVENAAGGAVFESDLYNPGNGGQSLNPAYAVELLTGINNMITAGLSVDVIIGGHGAAAPLAELQAFVQAGSAVR